MNRTRLRDTGSLLIDGSRSGKAVASTPSSGIADVRRTRFTPGARLCLHHTSQTAAPDVVPRTRRISILPPHLHLTTALSFSAELQDETKSLNWELFPISESGFLRGF
jgi:hypothetical protein